MASESPSIFDPSTRQRIERLPRLGEFVTAVQRILTGRGSDGFWDCGPELNSLVCSSFPGDLIRSELVRTIESPFYVPTGNFEAMIVAKSPLFTLTMKLFQRRVGASRTEIYGLPEHLLIAVVGPGPVVIDVYGESPGYRNDLFDRTRTLIGPERRALAPGDIGKYRSGYDALLPVDVAEPSLAFIMTSERIHQLQWVYAAQSQRADRILSADPMTSRLEFAVAALAELDAEAAVPSLLALVGHPQHFVRWSAVRSLIRIDFRQGLAMVQRCIHDAHPHVRNAALRALDKIEADGLRPAATPLT